MTTPQQNIWNLQKYYADTAISNLCGAIFYKEKRNTKQLQQAVTVFIEKQSGMRLRFTDGTVPTQYVSEEKIEEIPFMTFDTMDELDSYAKQFAKEPIGLCDTAMYRFVIFQVENQSGVLVVLSHLISDAWTFGLMANQVDVLYHMLEAGQDITSVEMDYLDYVQSEEEYFSSERYLKDQAYWESKYENQPERTVVKISPATSGSIAAKRITKVLPAVLEQKIDEFCRQHPVTQAVLFETALMIYLSKINPENSAVTIGVPVLNRSNAKERKIAGMFVSTMPLTLVINETETVGELSAKITKEHMNIFRHQKYPYSSILQSLREKQNFQGNLYDVMISYQNAQTDTGADTKWYSNGASEVPFVIHIDNRDSHECHTINVDYQSEVFGQETEVRYIIERLEYIIEQIVENYDKTIKDIHMIPEKEWKQVVYDFNDTYVEYPRKKCVHELYTEQAQKTPDAIALVFEEQKFTYKELDEMSNSLAHYLRNKGVKPNDVVAVILNRDEKVIITQLAVLKLGAVFVPIDSRYPRERIAHILLQSNAKLILKNKANSMMFTNECVIEECKFDETQSSISETVNAKDICYIIFTSGSTGEPKGCTLTNQGLVNFCTNNNILDACNSLEHQICISVNTISFDYFIAESLLPLLNGFTVVLASEEESTNQEKFKEVVKRNRVNIIQTTPTRYRLYFNEKTDLSYARQFEVVVTSGEALTFDLLENFCKYTNSKIFNPLGPSECSVWVVGGELHVSDKKESVIDITIGSPIANTQIYILDKHNHPLPIGVAGELCIAGDGVGKGYLNRPELTAEKFVPNLFADDTNHHGKVMYHTGDLARWRADGEIEYLGRMDTQVKIRGLRIELGEIESVMSGFAGVGLTAVADKRDENNRQYLVGYYTVEAGNGQGSFVDEKQLRQHLAEKLPKYMVPNYFMKLDKMPMTPSGKTDRKNLPVPDFSLIEQEYVAPQSEQEALLCHLLEEILHMERVGVEDDFFEYGGDSLAAIEYVARAHEKGVDIALQNIFDYPTVRGLCAFLGSGAKERVQYEFDDFNKYEKLLAENVVDESFEPCRRSLGNVLLTGATGFLGAHVLDRFMSAESGKVYCLIRSNAKDDRRGRLYEMLEYYFGKKYEAEYGKRIIPIVGDMEMDGLSEQMPDDVQTVIHTAASVKHYGSYDYFHKVNVEGTQHVIDYAKSVGAKLIHVSTLSVSGNSMADEFAVYRSNEEMHFYETSLYIGQPLDNVYIHSKFEAEKRVYDAMLDGLDAKVIRVGNLTNRTGDYKFQPNYKENAFLTRVKAILEFGMFPAYLMHLYSEFSPVDLTAEGIIRIAEYAKRQTVFHLNSNRPIYFDRFLEVVHTMGIPMQVVDGVTFNLALQKTIKNTGTEYIFEAFQNDMDEKGQLVYDSNIRIENEFTLWFLKKVGFEWNETDVDYIRGYIAYFRKIGYLEV